MSGSMDYWNIASTVQERLNALSATGNEMYAAMESNDDPAELAETLAGIETRLSDLAKQIASNVPVLHKVAKALNDLPGIR